MEHKEIVEKFKAAKKRQIIVAIPLVIFGVLAVFFSDTFRDGSVMPIVILIIVLAALLFSAYNWRCPVCHTYLGKTMNPEFCHKCGTKLKE